MAEHGYEQLTPTTLHIDNKNTIALSQLLTGEYRKVRHFMARLRFLIEQVEKQVIRLEHMEGTSHPSDALSKSKPRPGHEKNTLDLMGPQRLGAQHRLDRVHAVHNPASVTTSNFDNV